MHLTEDMTYEALKFLPLLAKRGEGRGEELCFIENNEPLTLTLFPLGRGEGNFRELHNPISLRREMRAASALILLAKKAADVQSCFPWITTGQKTSFGTYEYVQS